MAGSLGHISGTVSLDINPFKQSTRVLQQQIKATGNAVRAQETAIKSSGKSINDLKANYATMGKQLQQYNALLSQQRSQFESYKSSIKDVNGATDEQKNKLSRLENEYNKTAASTSRLEAKMQATARTIAIQDSGWTKAGEKLTKFGNATTTAGDKLTSLGRKATIGITTPIVGGFTAAAKSAIDFNSQISAIGPLLTNGGKITASVRSELDQMSSSSKKWAMQFGVSTGAINDGMTEMVKRGYTAQQTMGAMPAVLNAAKASGDDFNDVMHVSTSVLEQFGLKTESTTGMLKNTSRVTDSLTYVANATAAGFQDMGEAMTYVGPSAHAAGISLEETAAAIGIMSNKGIEGSVAGTALRGALTRLMKPSKQNVAGFKAMGVSVEDFKKGTLTLPEIIDKIKNNTKGWTDQQRASSIALAFGTEAQAGMNALISAGGDELRKYTKGAKDSAGTTKQIADQLNDTQAAKVARFKESIHVLGIEFGEKLLPTLTPLIEKLTSMIRGFSNMDSATQRSIIKWALFAAAIGPVSGALGNVLKVTGSVSSGLGGLFTMLGRVSGTSKAAKLGIEGAGTALTSAGKGAGLFSSGLSLLNPYVLGTTAVVGAGVAVWELWGKKAVESANRTSRWGTDVGAAADQSLSKMQNFSSNIQNQLEGFASKSESTTKAVALNFNGMYKQLEKDSEQSFKKLQKDIDDLPAFAKSAAEKDLAQKKATNAKIIADAKAQNNTVQALLKQHNGDVSKLSADEKQIVLNARTRMNADELKLLKIGGKAKRVVLETLNSDVSKLSRQQREQEIQELSEQYTKEKKIYKNQFDSIEKAYKDGAISANTYKKSMKELESSHKRSVDNMAAATLKLDRANGKSKDEIIQDLGVYETSYKRAAEIVDGQTKKMSKSTSLIAADTNSMSKETAKANEQWNKLIFDPKTGKVKTNAQEEITKAASSAKGWDALVYDLKHANLSSNAKLMIGEAAVQNGKWQGLTWSEKKAILSVKGREGMIQVMQEFGIWDQLNLKEQKAVIHGDPKPIVDMLLKGGQWNELSLKQQKALVVTNAGKKLMEALKANGNWESLSFETKKAVIESNSTDEVRKAMVDSGQWNAMSFDKQELLVENKASRKIMEALNDAGTWNKLDVKTQQAVIESEGLPKLADSIVQMGNWNQLPTDMKRLLVNDEESKQKLAAAGIDLSKFNNQKPLPKKLFADADDYNKVLEDSGLKMDVLNGKKVETKYLNANNEGFIGKVTQSNSLVLEYNTMHPELKQLLAEDGDVVGKLTTSKSALNEYNSLSPEMKQLIADTYGFDVQLDESTGKVKTLNATNTTPKQPIALTDPFNANMAYSTEMTKQLDRTNPSPKMPITNNNPFDAAFSGSIGWMNQYNNVFPNPKQPLAYTDAFNNGFSGAIGWMNRYNSTNPGGKTASVDASSVSSAKSIFGDFMDNWNNTQPVLSKSIMFNVSTNKHARGTNSSPGGLSILGDGGRQEPFYMPKSGLFGISPAKDTPYVLEKGTKVWSSVGKFMRDLPRFKNGTANNTRALGTLLKAGKISDSQNNVINQTVQISNFNSLEEKLDKLDKLDDVLDYLSRLLNKNSNLIMNGKRVGEIIEPNVSKNQLQNNVLTDRGVFNV